MPIILRYFGSLFGGWMSKILNFGRNLFKNG